MMNRKSKEEGKRGRKRNYNTHTPPAHLPYLRAHVHTSTNTNTMTINDMHDTHEPKKNKHNAISRVATDPLRDGWKKGVVERQGPLAKEAINALPTR